MRKRIEHSKFFNNEKVIRRLRNYTNQRSICMNCMFWVFRKNLRTGRRMCGIFSLFTPLLWFWFSLFINVSWKCIVCVHLFHRIFRIMLAKIISTCWEGACTDGQACSRARTPRSLLEIRFSRSSYFRVHSMIALNFQKKIYFLLLRDSYIHISVVAFERLRRSDGLVDHQPRLLTTLSEE